MNIAIKRNWQTKKAKIERAERNLANKKYALDLIERTKEGDAVGGLQDQKYLEFAIYEYKLAEKDLEEAKA